jgi:hypothetical protein
MRVVLLAGTVLLGAAAAHASSIDFVQTSTNDPSIETITCEACGPYNPKVEEETPDIVLAPGQQKIEIRNVNGEKKIFRTEAWFGGSPVVVVSKAPDQADSLTADTAADPDVSAPIGIDPNQTTSVNADMSGQAKPEADKAEAKAFDPEQMELRLK